MILGLGAFIYWIIKKYKKKKVEEIEELKAKLEQANADRASLIARLRDAQIHLQLKSDQLFEIQTALIEKLSIFQNENVIKTKKESQVHLHDKIEQYMPKVETDD